MWVLGWGEMRGNKFRELLRYRVVGVLVNTTSTSVRDSNAETFLKWVSLTSCWGPLWQYFLTTQSQYPLLKTYWESWRAFCSHVLCWLWIFPKLEIKTQKNFKQLIHVKREIVNVLYVKNAYFWNYILEN